MYDAEKPIRITYRKGTMEGKMKMSLLQKIGLVKTKASWSMMPHRN